MSLLVNDKELEVIRSLYPMLEIKALTRQMETALVNYMRGMTPRAASNSAGYAPTSSAFLSFIKSEPGMAILEYMRDKVMYETKFTREDATKMFLEAFHESGTSMEKIAATRELGRMHGVYEEQQLKAATQNITINQQNNTVVHNEKQLTRMSNAELLAIASEDMKGLMEMPQPIDYDEPVLIEQDELDVDGS